MKMDGAERRRSTRHGASNHGPSPLSVLDAGDIVYEEPETYEDCESVANSSLFIPPGGAVCSSALLT